MSIFDEVLERSQDILDDAWALGEEKASLASTTINTAVSLLGSAATTPNATTAVTYNDANVNPTIANPTTDGPATVDATSLTITASSPTSSSAVPYAVTGFVADAFTETMPSDITITEPAVTIPSEADTDIATQFDLYVADIVDRLAALFAQYIATYFPVDNVTNSYAEEWLQTAIHDGGTGVDTTVEALIWERDRSRIAADASRALDEATNLWAARRFPMPPGALLDVTSRIALKSQDELAKSSREVAIKTFDTEVANVRFAVENAIKLRQVALSSAADYIKALVGGYQIAQGLSGLAVNAQANLINAAAAFYNARTNAKDIDLKNKATYSGLRVDYTKALLNADLAVATKDADAYNAARMKNAELTTGAAIKAAELTLDAAKTTKANELTKALKEAEFAQANYLKDVEMAFAARVKEIELRAQGDLEDAKNAMTASLKDSENATELEKLRVSSDLQRLIKQAEIAAEGARAAAQIAAAAINNLNASVNLNAGGSYSRSKSESVTYAVDAGEGSPPSFTD